jgi:hypothetical protein
MSQHLSSERISMWMIGERTPEEEQHIRECPDCAAELARLETALALFRGSLRQWSERQGGFEAGRAFTVRPAWDGFRSWPTRLAVAAALLLLVVTVPIYRNARHPQPSGKIAQADALLLEQVDAEVSRAVPRPMEPLLELVSWDSLSTDVVSGSQSDVRKEKQ